MEPFIIFLMLFTIHIDPASHDYITDAIPTTDGGMVLVGSLHRNEGIVIKLDSNQSHEWTVIIPDVGEISSIVETRDGYIAVGHYPFISIHKFRGFGFIVSIGKEGKIKWMTPVEVGAYSEFHKVVSTQDGNFITVGLAGTGDSEDGWIVKFSTEGELIWYRACCDNSTEIFEDVKETSLNEFIIFGKSDDRPFIVTIREKDPEIEKINISNRDGRSISWVLALGGLPFLLCPSQL